MRAAIICIIGLVGSWGQAGAEPLVEGRVRLPSGAPVPGAQVLLFDLTDLGAAPLAATADGSGRFTLPLAGLAGVLPERFELGANYPNPFNPSTIIPYQLPAPMHVRLEVFNLLGQRIAALVDGEQPAGFHTAEWDATDASGQAVGAGVYLYRLSGDGAKITRRMLLIDGQAGVPAAAPGGPAGMGSDAGGEEGETAPVYGLVVSGPGLVPYVDPAFRVTAGMAPVEVVLEAPGLAPRAKVASGGILGDVDNTGRVDFFDALLVALYSQDASIVLPNNGDISLGDVNADGRVDLSDAWLIAAWLNDPADPSLPSGIGEAVGAAASLSPDPSTVAFIDDGSWHRFTVEAGEPVSVVVNPAGTPRGLEITTRSGRGNFCPAEADDDATRRDGQALYLSGCATGEATVELRRQSDGTVLRTYTFEVTGSPADLVVESVSVSASTLTVGQSFTLNATVRNQGTAGAEATTLRWYRSSNRTISTQDTRVGTNAVRALAAAGTSAESISLTAPGSEGTWYYGACVVGVAGESTGNNCSSAVRVIVEEVDNTPVTIPDASLRAAIAQELGKASGATIAVAEMKTLTRLDARDSGISDLTGLESATNLTWLILSDNSITDISPLSGLTNLTELDLSANRITNVSPLSGLTNLTTLELWRNRITDVSPLSGLTNLTTLELEQNNISNISPLAHLTNLTSLGVGENILDLSALSGLSKLTRLKVFGANTPDVSPLSGLTNLRKLVLSHGKIEDISALAGLTDLRELTIWDNQIEDISVLSGLTNLTRLSSGKNKVSNISPLSSLTSLTELFLNDNNIENTAPLSGLTKLTFLNLSGNRIQDISALSGLINLTFLNLSGNSIQDISPLVGLTNLQDLDLRGNPYETLPKGDFDIELVLLDDFTDSQKNVLQYIARRWMAVITEDLPDYTFSQGWSGTCGSQSFEIPAGERIDDLRVYVKKERLSVGTLGFAGPMAVREESHLSVLGCMGVDLSHANLLITALHETGHVLGVGSLWTELGYFQNPPDGDQHFNGPLAIAAFDAAGGRDYAGAKVPVEGGHWRGDVFGDELMTPTGTGAISAITAQSLADLGYGVDVSQADAYTLPRAASAKASAKIAARPSIPGVDVTPADVYVLPGVTALSSIPGDDRLRGLPESADWLWRRSHGFGDDYLMGRLAPSGRAVRELSCGAGLRQEPIHVVDPQGRIVRTLTD